MGEKGEQREGHEGEWMRRVNREKGMRVNG